MDILYDNVEYFFNNNGTLEEFHEVLTCFFKDKTIKQESDNK